MPRPLQISGTWLPEKWHPLQPVPRPGSRIPAEDPAAAAIIRPDSAFSGRLWPFVRLFVLLAALIVNFRALAAGNGTRLRFRPPWLLQLLRILLQISS